MIALDTNILIYACDRADSKRQQRALSLVSAATDAVLLWQVACEFVAASRKLGSQGFTPKNAWERLSEYLALFPLVLPSSTIFERARSMHTMDQWSFWDAMIVAASIECGVTTLYSEDLPGRVPPCALQIVNPFT